MKNNNKNCKIISLKHRTDLNQKAVTWFHEKWKVPEEAYLDSIIECQKKHDEIPQWYLVVDEEENIIAGAGLIENDFHKQKDLKPNVCALFVEKEYREAGIAKNLLDIACRDAYHMGYKNIYLITEHTQFYERCGWNFYGMVEEDNGHLIRMYQKDTYR